MFARPTSLRFNLRIRCEVCARRRRDIIHTLSGGGALKLGWGALHWTETSRAEPCRFGPHPVLRHLSKKVANFLHEYHADQFTSLALPLLPSDRSDIDIHSMLGPLEIALLLRTLNLSKPCGIWDTFVFLEPLKLDIQCIQGSSV